MKPEDWVNEKAKSNLTVEKLRTYKGFENITEEDAIEAIKNIKRLAKFLLNLYSKNNLPPETL